MGVRNMNSLLLLSFALVCAISSVSGRECAPIGENCTLPYCFCPGWEAPDGLDSIIDEVPQIVLLTFDDAVTISNHPMYEEAIFNRRNPNGAKVSATFFVTHEYNNYQLTHDLYRRGHEIALHSITHRTDPTYWATINTTVWTAEVCDQKKQLAHFAKIPENKIKGFRVPFLQPGGDRQFSVLASAECDLEYDCSRPTRFFAGDNPNKLWPYTHDYDTTFQDCLTTPCPEDAYPGFWTVPMVSYFGGNSFPCAMVDTCLPAPETAQEMYDLLKRNFDNHYITPTYGGIGNRAPFPMFFHAAFMQGEDNAPRWDGFIRFLDYLSTLEDVYLVSIEKALKWIKSPLPLGDVEDFPPWNDETPPTDQCSFAFPCAFSNDQTPFPGERYMTSCQPCPRNYPWVFNPLGTN